MTDRDDMFYSGIICSICGRTLEYYSTNNKTTLTRWARRNGWTLGKEARCPRCVKGRKK